MGWKESLKKMADIGEDVELGEMLLILGALGVGIYLLYKLFSSPTAAAAAKGATDQISLLLQGKACTAKVGPLPGIIGATQAQVCAANTAGKNLQSGGSVVWSCGSCYDYAQPNGDVVQVRKSFWGSLTGNPLTYTTVPRDCYVRPAGGTVSPQFACCYGCTCASVGIPKSAAGALVI